ncbi:MAG: RNA-binding domain-containing protein [Candidatus Zixiibacteriota bacterium]
MNQDEVLKLIKKGESETIEFKERFDKETIETASAFANTRGGTIFIGISDKGKIKGVQIGKETLKNWANQISQATEPRIIPEIEHGEIGGRGVVIVQIKEFPIKPVSVKGRCFRRVGNSNRIMPMQEIAQMHFHSTGMSWDKLPARDAMIGDIDFEKVRRYIRKANETGRRKIGVDEKPLQVLEKLELIKEGQPTWAAILLFRKDTKRFLSQAVIHCGRFKEEDIVIDDRMIEGTIIEQVDEAMDFIRKNINVRFVMTGKPAREQIWDYPLEALREAVINAVCHRDYAIPSNTEVRIYDDRLIVWSPGGLPLGITPEPQFEEYQGFRVIFRKDIYTEEYLRNLGLKERQIKAVMYVRERGKITNKVYREMTELSDEGARIDLNELVEKKVLQSKGRGRGAHYVLK